MPKFFGKIGYSETKETTPGVWVDGIVEREYYGDIIRNSSNWRNADKLNDDISINNSISIIADPYAMNAFHKMRYVTFIGAKWKITNVEVEFPRIILTLGGVYNGDASCAT